MNGLRKMLAVVGMCVVAAILAKTLPAQNLSVEQSSTSSSLEKSKVLKINTDKLVSTVSERSIFISKSEVSQSEEIEPVSELDQLDWSPLDYHLIGVSVSRGRKTGWFKNNEDGRLVSARQGAQLGGWSLESLSSTAATLKNGRDQVSLKLFSGDDPR